MDQRAKGKGKRVDGGRTKSQLELFVDFLTRYRSALMDSKRNKREGERTERERKRETENIQRIRPSVALDVQLFCFNAMDRLFSSDDVINSAGIASPDN